MIGEAIWGSWTVSITPLMYISVLGNIYETRKFGFALLNRVYHVDLYLHLIHLQFYSRWPDLQVEINLWGFMLTTLEIIDLKHDIWGCSKGKI